MSFQTIKTPKIETPTNREDFQAYAQQLHEAALLLVSWTEDYKQGYEKWTDYDLEYIRSQAARAHRIAVAFSRD